MLTDHVAVAGSFDDQTAGYRPLARPVPLSAVLRVVSSDPARRRTSWSTPSIRTLLANPAVPQSLAA